MYKTSRHQFPHDNDIRSHIRENLNSHVIKLALPVSGFKEEKKLVGQMIQRRWLWS
jgi:hypothetical protein